MKNEEYRDAHGVKIRIVWDAVENATAEEIKRRRAAAQAQEIRGALTPRDIERRLKRVAHALRDKCREMDISKARVRMRWFVGGNQAIYAPQRDAEPDELLEAYQNAKRLALSQEFWFKDFGR